MFLSLCKWRLVLTIYLPSPAPTGTPYLSRVDIRSATTASLRWSFLRCHDINGPELEYIIVYTSSYGEENVTVAGDQRSHLVTGLKPYTTYSFRCRAVNSIGSGPLSNVVSRRTYESG